MPDDPKRTDYLTINNGEDMRSNLVVVVHFEFLRDSLFLYEDFVSQGIGCAMRASPGSIAIIFIVEDLTISKTYQISTRC